MPHIPSEDMDMTTETVTQNNSGNSGAGEVIQTPKKIWITAFIFAFFTLLCDGADLGFFSIKFDQFKG